MSKKMGRPRIHATDEDAKKANRLKMDLRRGQTLEYASLSKADRRPFLMSLIRDGATDEEVRTRTGLAAITVQNARKSAEPPPPEVEESEAGIRLDDGGYMAQVRRLNLAPPPSWRFGRDLSVLPARPALAHSASSCATGWCADQGEHEREYHG